MRLLEFSGSCGRPPHKRGCEAVIATNVLLSGTVKHFRSSTNPLRRFPYCKHPAAVDNDGEIATDTEKEFNLSRSAQSLSGLAVATDRPPEMSSEQAAAYLAVEAATLAIWRSTKRYPLRSVKVGRRIRYRKSNLDVLLDARTVGQQL